MAIMFNRDGPLRYATLFQINECLFYDKTRPPIIDARDDDEDYLVRIGDRLDLIASRRLGNENLGWVIMLRNDLRLMPNDLVPGITIKIPSRDSLSRRGIV